MLTLNQLSERFNAALLKEAFTGNPPELYEPIVYTLNLGGKRLRPVMMLQACTLFDGNLDEAMPAAIGIELFHNFTLLHDDIMDQAPLRRGKPSVYVKWDTNTAILSGDTMFAIAYDYVADTNKDILPEVIRVFTQTAAKVCEGQQFDINYESQDNITIEEYLNMIRLKTAVLFGASLKIGAIIGGAGQKDKELISEFGNNLGMAFQLMDDLLDTYGDEVKFGKKIGGDIIINKKTYLYLKAFELAQGKDLDELNYLFKTSGIKDDEKIDRVIAVFNKLKVRTYVEKEMERYYQKAKENLRAISVSEDKKVEFNKIIDKFATRDN